MRAKSVFTIVLVLIIQSLAPANLVQNPSMEGNFLEQGSLGNVAEYWTGWTEEYSNLWLFYPGDSHEGQRGQGIHWYPQGYPSYCTWFGRNGIFQTVDGLNPSKTYKVSAWFRFSFINPQVPNPCFVEHFCNCAIGIDTNAGINPFVQGIQWAELSADYEPWTNVYEGPWVRVVTFFSATGQVATLFLQISGAACLCEGPDMKDCHPVDWGADGYIDDVVVEAVDVGQASKVEATSPVPADGVSYSEVKLTILDSNSNPVEGIPPSEIVVTCTGSGNTIIGPDKPTDENGQTTAKIMSIVAETKTVSVTVLGTLLSDTAEVEFIPRWIVLTVQTNPSDVNTVTPTVGTHNYAPNAVVDISASRFVNCPDVYVFNHWEGAVGDVNAPKTTVTMDTDKTITAVFNDGRQCGDECHPYPSADLDKNCKVDFLDFALFTAQWLECTDPNCD